MVNNPTTDHNNTPKILIWIVDVMNILTFLTAIIFLIFTVIFIDKGHTFLAIFESFFCLFFLSITVILRKLRLATFR